MTKHEYSKYQKDVIRKYYQNQEAILLQNLQELVTDLYLCESQEKKKRLWERAKKAMEGLKVQPAIIEHIMSKANVEILAKNVSEWIGGKINKCS